jgi:hypothetical protein
MKHLKTLNIIFLLTVITGIDARYNYDVWTYLWGLSGVIWIGILILELWEKDFINH